jgi:hypothetical protein
MLIFKLSKLEPIFELMVTATPAGMTKESLFEGTPVGSQVPGEAQLLLLATHVTEKPVNGKKMTRDQTERNLGIPVN